MEVTCVCFALLMLILLGAHVKNCDAVFHIVTKSLQYFKYESVSFHCKALDGSSQFKGIRNADGFLSSCRINTAKKGISCSIDTAYPGDSGVYWCETNGGQRSSSVNITITAGSVILESPALSVMAGANVTLRCRRRNSSNAIVGFYKDGGLIGESSTGEFTIHRASRSDEGRYTCSTSEDGESPQSWLTVRADSVILACPVLPVTESVNLTLHCSINGTSSNRTANFYKDGLFVWSSPTGNLTIHGVSKSDEGLYTCSISGSGESAESWLAVRAHHRETCSFSDASTQLYLVLRTVFTIVMVALLLLLVGLLHSGKKVT